MTGAMNAAIAGLRTHMQNMNVIGNNIANVNTEGYKSARSVFKSSIYSTMSGGSNGTQSIGGRNPSQIGYGSTLGTVDIDMSTGNYKVTGKSTDCMIDGDGFFLVGSKDIAMNFKGTADDKAALTSLNLTRVGNFDVMADGYLCKDEGNCVYGFLCVGVWSKDGEYKIADAPEGVKEGDPVFSDQLVPLRVPYVYQYQKSEKDPVSMQIGYPRVGGGTVEGDKTAKEAIAKTEGTKRILDYGAKVVNGEVIESPYHERGYYNNITINQNTGIITATCQDLDNQVITIGCIAIGSVTNPNGVTQIGNSYYKASDGSGDLVVTTIGGASKDMRINYINSSLNEKNTTGANWELGNPDAVDALRIRSSKSEILSNGLEMSKTDLAQEIANMITTQRGYQANTRIVTVTDQMLEELVNMKR